MLPNLAGFKHTLQADDCDVFLVNGTWLHDGVAEMIEEV